VIAIGAAKGHNEPMLLTIFAQGGAGLVSKGTVALHPAYQALLGFAALFFLMAVLRGAMDLSRKPPAGTPKPTVAVSFSRYWSFVLSLMFLIVILLVFTGILRSGQQMGLLGVPMGMLAAGQFWTVVMVWRNPEAKPVMRIIHTLLLVCAVATLPLLLMPSSG